MLELYHWEPNTASLKLLIVLNEKGLPFTSRYTDFLAFEQLGIPHAGAVEVRHNPEGEAPVLVDHGTAMTESFFASLYLDEAYPQVPLRPADAYGRFKVLAWARFLNEAPAPAVSTLGCAKFLAPSLAGRDRAALDAKIETLPTKERQDGWRAALAGAYSPELIAESERKVGVAIQRCEDALAKSDWLVGDAYSLSDIDAFSLLYCVPELMPDAFAAAPRTRAWRERIAARPAVQKALKAGRSATPQCCFAPGPEHSRWG